MWFKHTLSMVAILLLGTLSQIHLVNAQAGEPITSSPVPVPVGTSCTQPRIRRSWELYSEADKALYIKAVGIAMTQGLHQKMVELHTEWFSELEAHKNCMFIYWHRMYLLGYENMLRSLGPEYQCITLPYWDHLASTARRSVGLCSNLEDCSPVIKSFGGSSIGPLQSLTVYNQTILRPKNGVCVNQSMLVNFCGNTTTKVCAKCVVRGPVKSKAYPAEAFFGAVYQQVFQYSDWSSFATAVERGVHNMIHGAIGGVMTYFQSPTDPIFYSHHGFIDALQTIYLKCQIGGEQFITPSSLKGTDPRWFTNCPRRNAGIFNASDNITMNVRDYSMKTWGNVRTMVKSILYPYFKDLPATFGDYVDAKDIGAYSYTYEFSGALSNMYINCKDSVSMSASQSVAAPPPTTTSGIMFLAQHQQSSPGHGILTPVIFGPTTYETRMRRWTIAMFEAAKIAGYTVPGAKDQMEMILCVHKQECLGGVEDFDPVFRKNFGVTGHARCFTLLQYLQQGKRIIGVPGWREMTSKFLPCPSRQEPNVQMA